MEENLFPGPTVDHHIIQVKSIQLYKVVPHGHKMALWYTGLAHGKAVQEGNCSILISLPAEFRSDIIQTHLN